MVLGEVHTYNRLVSLKCSYVPIFELRLLSKMLNVQNNR